MRPRRLGDLESQAQRLARTVPAHDGAQARRQRGEHDEPNAVGLNGANGTGAFAALGRQSTIFRDGDTIGETRDERDRCEHAPVDQTRRRRAGYDIAIDDDGDQHGEGEVSRCHV